MQLTVNGQPVVLEAPVTLAQWLEPLAGKRIACELNQELVPRSQWAQTVLQDGDRLEVVTAIGGG